MCLFAQSDSAKPAAGGLIGFKLTGFAVEREQHPVRRRNECRRSVGSKRDVVCGGELDIFGWGELALLREPALLICDNRRAALSGGGEQIGSSSRNQLDITRSHPNRYARGRSDKGAVDDNSALGIDGEQSI